MDKETIRFWMLPFTKLREGLNRFFVRHDWGSTVCVVLCIILTPLATIYSVEYFKTLWAALPPLIVGGFIFVYSIFYGIFEKEVRNEKDCL